MKKIPFYRSLKFRIPLLIFAGVTPIALTGIYYATNQSAKNIQQKTREAITAETKILAESITRWEQSNILALKATKEQPDIVNMNPAEQKPVLESLTNNYEHIYLAHTVDRNGWILARSDDKKPGGYRKDRPWFKQPMKGKEIARQLLISRTLGQPALCFSSPIRQAQAQITGVLAICSDLKELTDQVGLLRFTSSFETILIDDSGNVIAHSDPEYLTGESLRNLSHYAPVKNFLLGNERTNSFIFSEEETKKIAFSTLLPNNWGIIRIIPADNFFAATDQLEQIMWIVSIATVLGLAIVIWIVTNYSLDSICRLERGVQSIEKGNLDPIEIESDDETETIAIGINSILAKLETNSQNIEADIEKRIQMIRRDAKVQIDLANANRDNFLRKTTNSTIEQIETLSQLCIEVFRQKDREVGLRKINAKSHLMLSILSDLKNWLCSGNCLGRYQMKKEAVNLKQLCNEAIEIVTNKQAEIQLSLDINLPEYVLSDRLLLRKLLLNLLSNAVKFTHSGSVLLSLKKIDSSSLRHCQIKFSVMDTGIGISQENLTKIFKPFYQVTTCEGWGFGLTSSQQIVKSLGGHTIQVFSQRGHGSNFSFQLIFENPPQRLIPLPKEKPSVQPFKRILLVEDSLTYQKSLESLLVPLGFSLTIANNGVEGLEMAQKDDEFDLILTDLLMPVQTGLTLIEELRQMKKYKNIPIIVISASFSEKMKEGCLKQNVTCLDKPINREELLSSIHQLLDLKWSEKTFCLNNFKEQLIANENKLFI